MAAPAGEEPAQLQAHQAGQRGQHSRDEQGEGDRAHAMADVQEVQGEENEDEPQLLGDDDEVGAGDVAAALTTPLAVTVTSWVMTRPPRIATSESGICLKNSAWNGSAHTSQAAVPRAAPARVIGPASAAASLSVAYFPARKNAEAVGSPQKGSRRTARAELASGSLRHHRRAAGPGDHQAGQRYRSECAPCAPRLVMVARVTSLEGCCFWSAPAVLGVIVTCRASHPSREPPRSRAAPTRSGSAGFLRRRS